MSEPWDTAHAALAGIDPTAVHFNETPVPYVAIYTKTRDDLDLMADRLGLAVKEVPIGKGATLHRAAGRGIAVHHETRHEDQP